jgi:galactokinase
MPPMPPDRVTARAPGRVNLIGEHTDYNDGLCLPFAIEQGVTVTATALDEPRIEALATDLGGERDDFALPPRQGPGGWRAFVRGVAAELLADGHELRGARLVIEADLPRGAGLSSSAALTAALSLALLGVAGVADPDRIALARACSRVERRWVGAQTGLLDQLAVLLARPGHALRLDLRDLGVRPVPLDLRGHRLAVLDSGAPRGNAESGYNARRVECERARDLLGLASLRDATLHAAATLPAPLDRRVRHVLTENARVDATIAALRAGDLGAIAAHLDASHASLRDDYDASVPAVEATIARATAAGATGARMMGGGFGGAVLALFPPDATPPPKALVVSCRGSAAVA